MQVNEDYVKMFWVGLMDGDGSIQVNHWRKKNLQYRFIIKLSHVDNNYSMLVIIAKVVGGTVRIVNNNKEVIWVVDKKDTILELLKIFSMYPPLTSRLLCQLKFLIYCLKQNNINSYLSKRNDKYLEQNQVIKRFNKQFILPAYFPSWLSGFIEAEGCFSVRLNKNNSFSIGQKHDYYILQAIKNYFNLKVMVRNPYNNFYCLETYSKESIHTISNHCTLHPLLGNKSLSLHNFITVSNI
jgi:hypothetical protein